MKMICEVPDEVIKCIKDGTWCGSSVAEKMIANGIPLSSSEELCEDAISRQAVIDACDQSINLFEVVDRIKELAPVNQFKPINCPSMGIDCEDCPAYEKKSECEHDHEILKAYSDGASAVLDKIKTEIESKYKSIPETFHHYETGFTDALEWVLSIIDKYKAEGSGE